MRDPDDAPLLISPGKMIVSACAWMERAGRLPSIQDADLELRTRATEAAEVYLESAAALLSGLREFTQARNAYLAGLSGDMDAVEWYRKRLQLPVWFPENQKRIRGEAWRFRDAVFQVLHEREWLQPPHCTHMSHYTANSAWQIFKDRKREDEWEHIKAGKQNIVIRSIVPDKASNWGYDESIGFEPPRTAIIDFRSDFHRALDTINADPQFRAVMAARLFDEARWTDLSPDANSSTRFRRKYKTKLRQFNEHMKAYLTPPLRRILEQQLEAEACNRPAYLNRIGGLQWKRRKGDGVENQGNKVAKNS